MKDIREYRFVDKALKDFVGEVVGISDEVKGKYVYRFIGYKDGNKINCEFTTLEEMNNTLGDYFYKHIIREEKLKELGL